MARKNFSRIAGVAGLGFAVLILSLNAFLAPAGLPLPGAEIDEVIAFFSTQKGLIGSTSALAPLTWVTATVFGAGALIALWRSGRGHATAWALVGLAGILMQNLTFTGVMATRLALASTPAGHDQAVSGLWALNEALFIFNGTFLALALVGLSAGGRVAEAIPGWHAWMGYLAAALQFGSATLSPLLIDDPQSVGLLGLAGWLLWAAWIAVYGIVLIRLPSVTQRGEPQGSPTDPGDNPAGGVAAHASAPARRRSR
ncbi:hypothetical protein [Nonomuraea diastatica]|uniref:hypothetical protein n=1 Tax=Nonomuraea diastatica TaxID=1848329 RepID=UPI0015F2BBF9|nr:hypothetical protein [Nonomuraea diastatica]